MTYYKKNGNVRFMEKNLNTIVTLSTNGVSRIKINKPESYNALSLEVLESLTKKTS